MDRLHYAYFAGCRCIECGAFYIEGKHPYDAKWCLGLPYPCPHNNKELVREIKLLDLPIVEAVYSKV